MVIIVGANGVRPNKVQGDYVIFPDIKDCSIPESDRIPYSKASVCRWDCGNLGIQYIGNSHSEDSRYRDDVTVWHSGYKIPFGLDLLPEAWG